MKPLGKLSVEPETYFFWDNESVSTAEITALSDSHYLVRVSKSYRLIKQDEEGRETWTNNLVRMNEYLSDTFSHFSISATFVDSVSPESTDVNSRAEELGKRYEKLEGERRKLVKEIEKLEKSSEVGFQDFESALQSKVGAKKDDLGEIEDEISSIRDEIERKKREWNEWERKGVMLAYIFTVSTDPEICAESELDKTLGEHLGGRLRDVQRSVRQVLEGENFRLQVEELTEPRVFHRLENSYLLNPSSLEELENQYPSLEGELGELHEKSVKQFEAYSTEDLRTREGRFERRKSTPAKAVYSILKQLESSPATQTKDVPNDGPLVGVPPNSNQPFGFDPVELDHIYINGATQSGKTVLKRVLVENCASKGYDVLSITPSDKQGIGAAFPNQHSSMFERHDNVPVTEEHAISLSTNQYWKGDERLLDTPEKVEELFEGVNFLTLDGLSHQETVRVVREIFEAANRQRDLVKPLFIFLDEAHNFTDNEASRPISKAIRETAKHDVHVGLSTQLPTDLSYTMKEARLNLTTQIFLKGTDVDYIEQNGFLDQSNLSPSIVNRLEKGQAIFSGSEFPNVLVNVRPPFSHTLSPSDDMIDDLDSKLEADIPFDEADPEAGSEQVTGSDEKSDVPDLTEAEKQLLEFIEGFIQQEDMLPTKSKCYREGPLSQYDKVKENLSSLVQKGVISKQEVERGGQTTEGYRIN